MTTGFALESPKRDGLPWIYVSWITGLLAGEQQCVYAAWVKSHHRYQKRPDRSFNLAAWNADHTALLEQRRAKLAAEGWRVRIENENAFRLKGETAILAGKPDLIALRDGHARVVDTKTGQPRNKDFHQVLIYLLAVPKVWTELQGHVLEGEVCYPTHVKAISIAELTVARREAIGTTVKAVAAAAVAPKPVPSAAECQWCDVAECTARIDTKVPEVLVSEF